MINLTQRAEALWAHFEACDNRDRWLLLSTELADLYSDILAKMGARPLGRGYPGQAHTLYSQQATDALPILDVAWDARAVALERLNAGAVAKEPDSPPDGPLSILWTAWPTEPEGHSEAIRAIVVALAHAGWARDHIYEFVHWVVPTTTPRQLGELGDLVDRAMLLEHDIVGWAVLNQIIGGAAVRAVAGMAGAFDAGWQGATRLRRGATPIPEKLSGTTASDPDY